jgi:hypothetical protein
MIYKRYSGIFIGLMCMVLTNLPVQAQEIPASKVKKAVMDCFHLARPVAQHVEWFKYKAYYEARILDTAKSYAASAPVISEPTTTYVVTASVGYSNNIEIMRLDTFGNIERITFPLGTDMNRIPVKTNEYAKANGLKFISISYIEDRNAHSWRYECLTEKKTYIFDMLGTYMKEW